MSPEKVIESQGPMDSPEAIRRGNNIIEYCAKLGGSFVIWNSQAQAFDVLLLKKSFRDEYAQRWFAYV